MGRTEMEVDTQPPPAQQTSHMHSPSFHPSHPSFSLRIPAIPLPAIHGFRGNDGEGRTLRKLKILPEGDRPREKITRKGPESLTETELLAVLLGSGTKTRDVLRLAAAVRRFLSQPDATVTVENLTRIEGLGKAKACQIMAALELARRRQSPRGTKITKPEDILPLVAFIAKKQQEYLVCVSLTGAGEVLACRVVTIGLLDSSSVHPREVFADPITARAAGVIIAHNHPSGVPHPSRRDMAITRKLARAGEILGIPVQDHLILTANSYFSFKKHKLF